MTARPRFDTGAIARLVERSGTRDAVGRAWGAPEEISTIKTSLKRVVQAYLDDHAAQLTLADLLDQAQQAAPDAAATVALTPDVPLLAAYGSLLRHDAQFVRVPTEEGVLYVRRNVIEEAVRHIRDLFLEEGGEYIARLAVGGGAQGIREGIGAAIVRRSITIAMKSYGPTVNYCYRCQGNPSHKFGSHIPRDICPEKDAEGHVRVGLTLLPDTEC